MEDMYSIVACYIVRQHQYFPILLRWIRSTENNDQPLNYHRIIGKVPICASIYNILLIKDNKGLHVVRHVMVLFNTLIWSFQQSSKIKYRASENECELVLLFEIGIIHFQTWHHLTKKTSLLKKLFERFSISHCSIPFVHLEMKHFMDECWHINRCAITGIDDSNILTA